MSPSERREMIRKENTRLSLTRHTVSKWGGRMPRNPRPDQIGMGGRMLSVQVAGSPRNAHRALRKYKIHDAA